MSRASVFHGGVQLPPNKVPVQLPTARLPLQFRYDIPLTTRGGQYSAPHVELGSQVLGGELIAGGRQRVGVHAPTSGTVTEIHAEGEDRRIVLIADGEQRSLPPRAALAPENATLDDLREAGLAGMGGAGFPTADKLNATQQHPPKLLIINAVECEPQISCDAQLIAEDCETLLLGADWLRRFVGATACKIVLEEHNSSSKKTLDRALLQSGYPHLSTVSVPTRYPAGSERQLVHAITGTALAAGARPLDAGVLVQNAATVHALGRWARDGSPLTERLVTVTGERCLQPQTLWCAIGAPISALLTHAGIAPGETTLFQGGPVMGFALPNADTAITKHSQCIRLEAPAKPLDTLACIRCGDCADACPEDLLPQQLHWQLLGNSLPGAQAERLSHCILCGCCDLVCPSNIPLSQQFALGKSDMRLRQHTEQRAAKAKLRFDARALRLEAQERERLAKREKRKAGAAKPDKKKALAEALARSRAKKAKPAPTDAGQKND